MARTIFALFDDALAALGVAGAFEREGHDRSAISLIVPDPRGRYARPNPDGAEGLRVFQPLSAPNLGPAAITGPLAPVLIEETAARGGLAQALASVGFGNPAARHFFERIRRGQAVIAVEMPEDRARASVELMRRLGARAVENIETGAPAQAAPTAEPETVTVPVVEEELEVGKRQVQGDGVRIHSRVVEEPVEESISLREERLHVERRPVSRDATEQDLSDFREGTIEFHETFEEPVITKRRRVVEEIVVGKETRERTHRISETVRKAQVRIEEVKADDQPGGPGAAA